MLAAGWHALDASARAPTTARRNIDPADCDGQTPPLDGNGNIRSSTTLAGRSSPRTREPSAAHDVLHARPDGDQDHADLPGHSVGDDQRPAHLNPYDSDEQAAPPIATLIPWAPKQPGIGFPIALTGTLDKFVETSSARLLGHDHHRERRLRRGHRPERSRDRRLAQFLAVETTDFLGEVFLCQDPATGDLLGARMYTPVADILDWFAHHPGAYARCGIIIRYSPYGNYADYITSLTNGVRLGITQGGGFGRVVDATLFVPGQ